MRTQIELWLSESRSQKVKSADICWPAVCTDVVLCMLPVCTDVNECSELDGVCRGGVCKNTFGGFTCTCPAGYQLDHTKQICAGTHLYLSVYITVPQAALPVLHVRLSVCLCQFSYTVLQKDP